MIAMSLRLAHSDPQRSIAPLARRRPRVCVLGAALGTGNLGVDALGISMVQGLLRALGDVDIVYQCWDTNRPVEIPLADHLHRCEALAIRQRPSWKRFNGVLQLQRFAKWRRRPTPLARLAWFSPVIRQLTTCDVAIDVSAGDSFSDIYGQHVFWYQTQIKQLCLDLGLPLILMPQTYGPFASAEAAHTAGGILSQATLVATREQQGESDVIRLCGKRSKPPVVRTPDMAFTLVPTPTPLPELMHDRGDETVIGLNVSGLLYFGRRELDLCADYVQLTHRLLAWALSMPRTRVLLIPHVVRPTWAPAVSETDDPSHSHNNDATRTKPDSADDTDDLAACRAVLAMVPADQRHRVAKLRGANNAAQAKYAVGHCDFFIGARMHAYIAAVSQATPAVVLAYSKKAAGLAELVGVGEAVVDMRTLDVENCLAAIDRLYQQRHAQQQRLEATVPLVQEAVRDFFATRLAPLILAKAGLGSPEVSLESRHPT
jgi:colanic acid/amylovoran biosynthesis protein